MYVIEKMQVNRLQRKPIVTNKALFQSVGARPVPVASQETADCVNDPVPYTARKTQLLHLGQKIADAAVAQHQSDGQADNLNVNPSQL